MLNVTENNRLTQTQNGSTALKTSGHVGRRPDRCLLFYFLCKTPRSPDLGQAHLWPAGSHAQNMFLALNLGSPGGLGRPFAGHAALGRAVESGGTKSPTGTSATVSTTLSSSACGVGAAHLHACSPDWIAETGQGRSKGRVGQALGLSWRWCAQCPDRVRSFRLDRGNLISHVAKHADSDSDSGPTPAVPNVGLRLARLAYCRAAQLLRRSARCCCCLDHVQRPTP
jgi:hypothetical protein